MNHLDNLCKKTGHVTWIPEGWFSGWGIGWYNPLWWNYRCLCYKAGGSFGSGI